MHARLITITTTLLTQLYARVGSAALTQLCARVGNAAHPVVCTGW
jgi:hypothetical protein